MKKGSFALLFSITAMIISLIAVCKHEAYNTNLLSGLSYLVGFTALVVAIFVMAQIYQAFHLKKEMDEQNSRLLLQVKEEREKLMLGFKRYSEQLSTALNEKIEKEINDYDHTISANIYQVYAISEHLRRNHFKLALDFLMRALEEVNLATKDKTPLEGIIDYIQVVKEEGQHTFSISKDEKERYNLILAETKDSKAFELMEYIQSLERA